MKYLLTGILITYIALNACTKKAGEVITPKLSGSQIALSLEGERNWSGHYSYWDHTHTKDTSYALPDSAFAITYLHDSTIQVWGGKYVLYARTADTVCVFLPPQLGPKGHSTSVKYNLKTNQIFFAKSSGGMGGGSTDSYFTSK